MPKEVGERSADEVQRLEDLDENVLFCKARAVHDMRIVALREGTRWDEVDWECQVCTTQRFDTYSPNGDLISRWYKPAPRSKLVGERMYAGDFRVEMLRRLKEGGMGVSKRKGRLRAVGA